jgi:CheY-like chemotaxis protein
VEATRLIKADFRTSGIPVILFSANTHVAELTREAGADVYIQKPFDIAGFEKVLEETINKKQYSNNEAV